MQEKWFGKSWGAPCCDPNDHVPTPIGRPCMHCREPMVEGSQGLIRAVVHEVRGGKVHWTAEPSHVDCFLRTIRPHGPECPHCRGLAPRDHAPGCAMRTTGLCDCQPMPEGK